MVTKIDSADDTFLNSLVDAKSAPRKTTTEVLQRGNESTDPELGGMRVSFEVTESGRAQIYDIRTGVMSTVLKDRLFDYLGRRHPDGSRVFTADKSKVPPLPERPYKCLLVVDSSERAKFATWGFPICGQIGFVSEGDRNQHMQIKHKGQWLKIQQAEASRRDEENLQLQRRIADAQLRAAIAMEKANRPTRKKKG